MKYNEIFNNKIILVENDKDELKKVVLSLLNEHKDDGKLCACLVNMLNAKCMKCRKLHNESLLTNYVISWSEAIYFCASTLKGEVKEIYLTYWKALDKKLRKI